MKKLNLNQGSPEWHAWRAGGIGASDVAAVIMWPYAKQTPRQFWMQKTGRMAPPDLSNNYFVLRGSRYEPHARSAIERWLETKGIYDIALPMCVEHDKHSFIRVSLDGLLANDIPVELKVPCWTNYQAVLQDGRESEPFMRYYPQVQDQLLATGADGGYLAFYQPNGNRIVAFEVERDQRFIDELLEAQLEWWDLFLRDKPPAMMDQDSYQPESPEEQALWESLSMQYWQLNERLDQLLTPVNQLKQEMAAVKAKLVKLMGGHMQGDYGGLRLVNTVRQGPIDMAAYMADIQSIFQLKGISAPVPDPEKYRKDGSVQSRIYPSKLQPVNPTPHLRVVNM